MLPSYLIKESPMIISICYRKSHLSTERAISVASMFNKAVSCVLETPHQATSEVDLLSETDRHQIFHWNRMTPIVVDKCIDSLIQDSAFQTPDTLALSGWDRKYTYRLKKANNSCDCQPLSTTTSALHFPRINSYSVILLLFL